MKSVLMSIQPKWCELIASGKKTVEVRKTKPKIETPFKVYIYCTKGKPLMKMANNSLFIDNGYREGENLYGLYEVVNGKVIGEVVCETIYDLNEEALFAGMDEINNSVVEEYSCVDIDELLRYKGDKKEIYGWCILNLVIYDKPKELSEFKKAGFLTEEEWLAYLYPHTHCHYEAWAKKFDITKPPQSWCYIEGVESNAE